MNRKNPIYTEKTNCQDCYKCVRYCSVKSIKINNGSAEVISDDCILCGKCVSVCPVGAKVIRNDIKPLQQLLKTEKVILSLAPSYVAEFPGVDPKILINKFKELGFYGVSETALGAEQVNHEIDRRNEYNTNKFQISSACPVAVSYIHSKYPEYKQYITPVVSPMIAHARLLKKTYGEDIKIAFAGPCIAKKGEADTHNDEIDIAITFSELAEWMKAAEIDLSSGPNDGEFIPEPARHATVYPIPGGMTSTLNIPGIQKIALTGLSQIDQMFEDLNPEDLQQSIFVETLACEGGCVNGPGISTKNSNIVRELAVRGNSKSGSTDDLELNLQENVDEEYRNIYKKHYSDMDLREALKLVGKHSVDDELNCGGCGYTTCREFAKALLNGRAEKNMCLSYLRKEAQKKANALIKCMPSGVVLVNNELKIIECNRNFAKIFGKETVDCFDNRPGMEGALLCKIVPFIDKFKAFLQSDKEYHQELIRLNKRIYNLSLFAIESNVTIGAIILDITNSELRREHIARQAQEVIEKNLTAVQEIACRLGENMADTEILLRAITDDYGKADYGVANYEKM